MIVRGGNVPSSPASTIRDVVPEQAITNGRNKTSVALSSLKSSLNLPNQLTVSYRRQNIKGMVCCTQGGMCGARRVSAYRDG